MIFFMKKEDKEELNRNKLLLDLIMHRYDEEERRNKEIDSKTNTMMPVLGFMFSLQSTLFTTLLLQLKTSCIGRIHISLILIASLIFYIYSVYCFIESYKLRDDFNAVPTSKFVIDKGRDKTPHLEIIKRMIGTYAGAIEENKKILYNFKSLCLG